MSGGLKILRDLAHDTRDEGGNVVRDGTQVFYTTHSPSFLSAGHFNEIFIARKTRTDGTVLRFAKAGDFVDDLRARKSIGTTVDKLLLQYRNAYEHTGDTQKANEGFFARKIILVEGPTEALLIPYLLELHDLDLTQEGISIVRCGGKNELDRFYRLYTEFGIPCYYMSFSMVTSAWIQREIVKLPFRRTAN